MAGARGTTTRGGKRPLLPGAGKQETGLVLLASFPDIERMDDVPPAAVAAAPPADDQRPRPRIGWGSIAILAVVAVATCTAAWWIDTGPIDPGAAEIRRVRLAERAAGSQGRTKTTLKTKTTVR